MNAMSKIKSDIVVEQMAVGDFISIQDHPKQRDTEGRLEKAVRRHLNAFSPAQASVSVVEFNGVRYKADGHTRSLAWSRNLLIRPDILHVTVYKCASMEELLALYDTFDNKDATETTPDKVSGALRLVGFTPRSSLLQQYRFASALRMASRGFSGETTDICQNVATFEPELRKIDSFDFHANALKVGVLAGLIMLIRKHGSKVDPIIQAVKNDSGSKWAGGCDGAFALSDLLLRLAAQKKGRGGNSMTLDLAAKTISCGERFMSNSHYTVSPKGVSVKPTKVNGYLKGGKK
jgi:hypothetical protein